jgi:hypothetical protein
VQEGVFGHDGIKEERGRRGGGEEDLRIGGL